MESSTHALPDDLDTAMSTGIHYPILLLDELLDKEHSNVCKRIGKGLENLASAGAVIIAATHKPNLLKNLACRKITLCAGKVLTETMI